jgi:hypothetical protein
MTEPQSPPPPTQPPLAEGRWLWRRIYVFSVSLGLWGLLAGIVRTATPETLPRISDGLMGLLALLLILYLVAPTAEQLLELLADMQFRVGGGR